MLEQVLSAYYTNKCSFEGQILGTFDANSKIYDAIAISKAAFTISQQQHLQGSLSMVTSEAQSGNYQSGPKVITISEELPTDSQQVCESESFPICRYGENEESKRRCECTDRSRIRIGAVLSDRKSSPFWEYLWQAAEQAAMDMGWTPLNGQAASIPKMRRQLRKSR
jgi:ABC-type sugar transport system substrate-binding protein